MKKHIILFLIFAGLLSFGLIYSESVFGQKDVKDGKNKFKLSVNSLVPYGWVNDYAGIMDFANRQKITAVIEALEKKTTAEIAVVTIPSLENKSLESFSTKLFNKWGIGKKGKNNGVMILVAVKEKKIRIETGRGMERIITNEDAGRIIREDMAPLFKNGDMAGGILAGVNAVAGRIEKDYDESNSEDIK